MANALERYSRENNLNGGDFIMATKKKAAKKKKH
jgi:hypothetical protein